MFSDPLVVTYNSSSKSLPRAASPFNGITKLLGTSSYATSDGEFAVKTARFSSGSSHTRSEIILSRIVPDSDPFTGVTPDARNSVGLIFEVNDLRMGTSVDVPLIRAALLSLVDSSFQTRLYSGEL